MRRVSTDQERARMREDLRVPPRVRGGAASTRAARVCGTRPSVRDANTPAHVPVLGAVLRPGVRRLGVARGGREVLRRRALVRRRVQRRRGDAEGARASLRERHRRHERHAAVVVRGAHGQGRARLGADGVFHRRRRLGEGEPRRRKKRRLRCTVSRNRRCAGGGFAGGPSRAPARRRVSRTSGGAHEFHATFCATWRRYVYVFPTRQSMREERTRREIDVSLLNEMLGRLVRGEKTSRRRRESRRRRGGRIASTGSPGVDCYAFARDTVAGKDSRVVFRVARAFRGHVPRVDDDPHGTETRDSRGGSCRDRARRKPLFAETRPRARRDGGARAATGAKPDVLLALAAARERSATASAAPPNGLFFAGVGYGDHPSTTRRRLRLDR